MDQKPLSIWKRPWRGPAQLLAWFGLFAIATFVVFFCIGLLAARDTSVAETALSAFLASLVLSVLAGVGLLCIRLLCNWRNLRRLLFVVACLITLVALAYAEENWRGKHAWQKYRRQWEAKGEKFDLAALVPPAVPDEKNFALAPLLKPLMDFTRETSGVVWRDTNGLARIEGISANISPHRDRNNDLVYGSVEKGTFADLKACAEFYRGNTNYPQAASSATAAETILAALGRFDLEIKELREAAASRPLSRFPIHYDEEPPWGILLRHLARIKGLTILTYVRATAELEAGHPAEAFEDLKLGLRFSDSITNEPFLIDQLVRIASLGIDLQTVREGLVRHAWTGPQLAEMETYLSSLNLLAEYKFAMRGERALGTANLDYIRRQGFRADPMDYMDDEGRARNAGSSLKAIPGGWYYQNMLGLCRLHEQFTLPAVDEQTHRVFPQVSENFDSTISKMRRGPYTIFAVLLFPALEPAAAKSARMQAYVDSARVACALERYRLANSKLPDTLDALGPPFITTVPNDIIDGKLLRYRPGSNGGYVLYSIGWNQTDDGGEIAWVKGKKDSTVDATSGDWVWKMTAE